MKSKVTCGTKHCGKVSMYVPSNTNHLTNICLIERPENQRGMYDRLKPTAGLAMPFQEVMLKWRRLLNSHCEIYDGKTGPNY